MNRRKPIWNILTKEQRKRHVETLMAFFAKQWDQPIGHVAAEDLLDTMLESVFNDVYNKGVADAQHTLQERMADVNVDLDLLKRT